MRRRSWTPPKLDRDATTERAAVPSWIASVCVHGTIMVCFALSMQSCEQGHSGAAEEDFKHVGIYVKPAEDNSENNPNESTAEESPTEETNPTETMPAEADIAETTPSLDEVPAELTLPETELPRTIGPGGALSELPRTAATADTLVGLEGAPPPGTALSAGQGTTSFFDIKAKGTRFVYIVDHSGSMGFYGQLRVAKAELMSSLQSLDSTQQFQIIFYNGNLNEMKLRGQPPSLWWGTDINRTLSYQFIRGVTPDGGTAHMPALRKALSYRPEHIFLLTDADQPILSKPNLEEVKRINKGRTQIHAIEFGEGGFLGIENHLGRLARQNGGTYRYRDVLKFGKR